MVGACVQETGVIFSVLSRMRESQKKYYERNREKCCAYQREYYLKNRHLIDKNAINERRRDRYRNDASYSVAHKLRSRLHAAVKGHFKAANTFELTGCTKDELVAYLENQLPPGADLKDYHIDHVRPIKSFNLADPLHQHVAFHYSNLCLLTPTENWAKSSTYDPLRWGGVALAEAQEEALCTGDVSKLNIFSLTTRCRPAVDSTTARPATTSAPTATVPS